MNSKESNIRANDDLIDMIESWSEAGIDVPEGIFAGLSTFLQIAMELSPTKKAFDGMVTASIEEAHRRCNNE